MDDKAKMVEFFDRFIAVGNNVITITPDGHVTVDHFSERVGLDDLQSRVGGLIEIACQGNYKSDDWIVYVDEEGLLKGLEENSLGNMLCEGLLGHPAHQPFFGNMVFLYGRDIIE